MNCPHCHATGTPGARFCAQCGAKLETNCSRCAQPIAAGSAWCDACGRSLGEAGAMRRAVTVLVAEIGPLSELGAALEPAVLAGLIHRFHEVLTRPLFQLGGVVERSTDAMLVATFGEPLAAPDDPERALDAAWQMQLAARSFCSEAEARLAQRVYLRVGLHTGLADAPAEGRPEDGPLAELAVRIAQAARPFGILVGEETARMVAARWEFVELAPVAGARRPRAVRTFEPTAPARERSADERPGFVGRAHELTQLRWAFDEAARRPKLVSVHGPAGSGKTRTVRHFVAEVARLGPLRVVEARRTTGGPCPTDGYVASLLAGWIGLDERAPSLAALEDWCAAQGSFAPSRDAELLGFFFGLRGSDPTLAALGAAQRRELATERSHQLLLAGVPQRTVLLLDDLHAADATSLGWLQRWLAELAAREPAWPMLVLAVHRSGASGLEASPELEPLALEVGAMPRGELEALCRSWLGVDAFPGEGMRAALLAVMGRVEGNPMLALELLRDLEAQGAWISAGPSWRFEPRRMPANLPTNLAAAVRQRLDRLSGAARQALQAAAILGPEFGRDLWVETCQAAELGTAWLELAQLQWLQALPRPGYYGFVHPLHQEVILQALVPAVRRELHQRAGTLMAERLAYGPHPHPQIVALHLRAGEDLPRALALCFDAGLDAHWRADDRTAQQLLLAALEARNRLDGQSPEAPTREAILVALGEVEAELGASREALGHFGRALAARLSAAQARAVHLAVGRLHEGLGAWSEALRVYEAALRSDETLEAPSRSALEVARARCELAQGRPELALERSEAALEGVEATARGRALVARAQALAALGRLEEATRVLEEALERCGEAADRHGEASTARALAEIEARRGLLSAAARHVEAALGAFEETGQPAQVVEGLAELGRLALEQDQLAEAEAHFLAAARRAGRLGDRVRLAAARSALGEAYSRQGRHPEAVATLREALIDLEASPERAGLGPAHHRLVRALIAAACDREAWEVLTAALKLDRRAQPSADRGVCYVLAGRIYTRAGRYEAAVSWISRGVGLLQGAGSGLELARSWFALAEALAAQGQTTHAAAAALKARELFGALGARYDRRILDDWLSNRSLTVSP